MTSILPNFPKRRLTWPLPASRLPSTPLPSAKSTAAFRLKNPYTKRLHRLSMERQKSTQHYQTFSTRAPTSRGSSPPFAPKDRSSVNSLICHYERSAESSSDSKPDTPIPVRQLLILAVISLAEQTALNSISPYLPEMAATFPEVDAQKVGLYVGLIASSFAAAQFAMNVFWGTISDRIGRKPVILLGTFLTAFCFVAFGFCRTLQQAIIVQVVMGLVNANAGIVSTVLGEITDRSNQSNAFSYLPLVYGIGGIFGPVLGGVLANTSAGTRVFARFPYLLPNIVSALILMADLILSIFLLDESLQEARNLPPLGQRLRCMFTWLWQFTASYFPSYLRYAGGSDDEDVNWSEHRETLAEACPALIPKVGPPSPYKEIIVPQIILLVITYGIFNLSNVAFNSLYPIYASAPCPTGGGLSPQEIGLLLGFGGAIAIVFQGFLFSPLQRRVGSSWVYRLSFLGLVVAFLAMPFVGRENPHMRLTKPVIWTELGVTVLIKNISTVGGLTCAMLMITNASPKPRTLGMLNGLAQSLSAGGRAIGPLVSGALFTVSTKIKNGGEFLSWGIFGGITAFGLILSLILRASNLESDGGQEESESLLNRQEDSC